MQTQQDIIIAGVGGQGILTIAGIIASAAVDRGLHVKQSEVHGMAQRGGAVVSHLRLSDGPIASDLIPFGSAQLILSMEPMEALRYVAFARRDAALVTSLNPVKNVPGYPGIERILHRVQEWPHHVLVDAEGLARKAGQVRMTNSVMLGAASSFLVIPADLLRAQLEAFFARKGRDVVEKNLAAFDLGCKAAGGGTPNAER
jgi:indolepyruvate ferredoxin oxidoreductase, beta subunit